MKTIIVIPAYNEEKTIGGVLRKLKDNGYKDIIVVDDGSTDNTFEIASNEKIKVFRYMINRGLGGALNTGILGALLEDADRQFNPNDIPKLISPILNKLEIGDVK